MIIPRKAQDCAWRSGKEVSSDWAAGQVGHSLAQQLLSPKQPTLAVQEPQKARLSTVTEEGGHRWQQSLPEMAAFSAISTLTSSSLCQLHLPAFLFQMQPNASHVTYSRPLWDDSLALFPGTEATRLKGQSRRIFKPRSLWAVSNRWVSEAGCNFISNQSAQRWGAYQSWVPF